MESDSQYRPEGSEQETGPEGGLVRMLFIVSFSLGITIGAFQSDAAFLHPAIIVLIAIGASAYAVRSYLEDRRARLLVKEPTTHLDMEEPSPLHEETDGLQESSQPIESAVEVGEDTESPALEAPSPEEPTDRSDAEHSPLLDTPPVVQETEESPGANVTDESDVSATDEVPPQNEVDALTTVSSQPTIAERNVEREPAPGSDGDASFAEVAAGLRSFPSITEEPATAGELNSGNEKAPTESDRKKEPIENSSGEATQSDARATSEFRLEEPPKTDGADLEEVPPVAVAESRPDATSTDPKSGKPRQLLLDL